MIRMNLKHFTVALAIVAGTTVPRPATAQSGLTLRVIRPAAVLEQPRGDSVVLGSLEKGTVVEVLDQQGSWFLVSAPAQEPRPSWRRGWIHADAVEVAGGPMPGAPAPAAKPGRTHVRGFGQAGGTLFTASDSFDVLLDSSFGTMFGGGAQVAFPNGLFAQVSYERFRKTGTRALVSGTQVFTIDTPLRITVTPLQFTVGYRQPTAARVLPYVGGGIGWHTLKEESSTLPDAEIVDEGHVGYHVVGGAEFALARWAWIAGEVQWAAVPKALGDTGISAVLDEDDLGGTTFRVKFIVGY